MELKWIEDFLKLAELGSFSRAADARYVTQPAFSRRIQALEAWMGVELVDRSAYPLKLTHAGEQFRGQASELLKSMLEARAVARGLQNPSLDVVHFASTHTIALNFFPHWLAEITAKHGSVKSKLTAANALDAVTLLTEGHCDFLMCYHHPLTPISLDAQRYEMRVVGSETLAPYARSEDVEAGGWALPGEASDPLRYLAYTPNAYLGRMVDLLLQQAPQPAHLQCVYETDMAEALKVMALEGHGVAWLPQSSVGRDDRKKKLALCGGPEWTISMEMRIYRDKRNTRRAVEQIWAAMPQK